MNIDPVVAAIRGIKPPVSSEQRRREGIAAKAWRDIYEQHMREHEERLVRVAVENADKLRSPEAAAMIGVTGELPEFTRRILGRAMAADKIGPDQPKVCNYESDGNIPTVLHNYRRK